MKKLHDVVIYADDNYYSAFPSIIARPDGELLLSFRRSPERRRFFAQHPSHCDPNSYLVMVRSHDHGETWSPEPELIFAHPLGGSQDPCMAALDDGSLLLTSYAWMVVPPEGISHASPDCLLQAFGMAFTPLGGYLLYSTDNGHTWQGPILPPECEGEANYFPGIPIPPCNRGAIVQARDGKCYWLVQRGLKDRPAQTCLGLLVSADRGLTWEDRGVVVRDDTVIFNETSLIETSAGDLVAFIRTANFDDHGAVTRSRDGGMTWELWQDMGVIGHPYHALRLPDGRIFLLYGYRHAPYGIRARVLDPECTRFDTQEIVLRDDGGNGDLGYPWACLTSDGRVLAVYYFNQADGTRHIAGTFLEI